MTMVITGRVGDCAVPTTTELIGLAGPVGDPVAIRHTTQRGPFAAPFRQVPDGLYCTVESGTARRERRRLVVHPRSSVSMNSYFGRFPASYWQRWTTVEEVHVEIVAAGTGSVSVCASDPRGAPRPLDTVELDAGGPDGELRLSIPVRLDRFVDGGALWVEFSAHDTALEIHDLRWTIDAPRPAQPRRTAVVLCTFNRAEDCVRSLGVLAADPEVMRAIDDVHVVDQGDQPVDRQPDFAELSIALGSKLHYRRQRNLGGAGGFTRGLDEAVQTRPGDPASVLFLDDDILLEPDVVLRMMSFADATPEPTIVGGQMLQLLHPHRLHVGAETARFTTIEPGLAVPGALNRVDLTRRQQDLRVDADYNAWWCCLIPSEVVADAGYPLPMFFQWDDVEFGYRTRARGHATVTLPGAGVWHADFDWKDQDDPARYFTLRNALIIDALHGRFDARASARVVRRWVLECLVSMRYAQAATLIRAVEDFLRGPDVLFDGGVDALQAVRQLRAGYPEARRHPASAVPGIPNGGRARAAAGPAPSRPTAVLCKRLVWQLLGRTRGVASVSSADAHWWHVSLFATAVVTDASQEAVRVRRVNRRHLITLARHAGRALRRLRREGGAAQRSFREAMPELTSRRNWQRLFAEHH